MVEVTLFCRPYDQRNWSGFPFHPRNNINRAGAGIKELTQFFEEHDPTVFEFQKTFVRKIVGELNSFDNIYFEVLNEGYGASQERLERLRVWQLAICDVIRRTEKDLPKKHLIAANAHQRAEGYVYLRIGDEAYADEPRVDIINYHYLSRRSPERDSPPLAMPEGKVGKTWAFLKSRRYLKRPLVFDENWAGILNGAPPNWTRNRMEA